MDDKGLGDKQRAETPRDYGALSAILSTFPGGDAWSWRMICRLGGQWPSGHKYINGTRTETWFAL